MAYPYQVQKKPMIEWSKVDKTLITLEKLELLTLSPKALCKDGYIVGPLTKEEIRKRMRCQNCGQKIKCYRPAKFSRFSDHGDAMTNEEGEYLRYSAHGVTAQNEYTNEVATAARSISVEKHHCFFHDGQQYKGVWQCCGGQFNTAGCCSNIDHAAGNIDDLTAEWVFHESPRPALLLTDAFSELDVITNVGYRGRQTRSRPRYTNPHLAYSSNRPAQPTKSIRSVVALDCEMGTSRIGNTELIRLSLVDFFTQETLIDSLVIPSVEMAHYNTRYSGVTFSAMNKAIRDNTGIRGTGTAREEVFKYVDSSTIVIVHGGSNDFISLRWIHPATRIIDTCVLETYDYKVKENGWKKSLKEVCKRRCGVSVQDAKLENGRAAGHDSLEDALATREVVCWWLRMIPDQ